MNPSKEIEGKIRAIHDDSINVNITNNLNKLHWGDCTLLLGPDNTEIKAQVIDIYADAEVKIHIINPTQDMKKIHIGDCSIWQTDKEKT